MSRMVLALSGVTILICLAACSMTEVREAPTGSAAGVQNSTPPAVAPEPGVDARVPEPVEETAIHEALRVAAASGITAMTSRVVRVVMRNAAGDEVGEGRGILIGSEQVVTACRVVQNPKGTSILVASTRPAKVVREDRESDLCLLEVAGLAAARPIDIQSEPVAIGQLVVTVGALWYASNFDGVQPRETNLPVAVASVTAFPQSDGNRYFKVTLREFWFFAGNSVYRMKIGGAADQLEANGAGVFDLNGRLIGITMVEVRDGIFQSFCLSAERVQRLVKTSPAPGDSEANALFAAVERRDVNAVKSVLEQGADVNARGFWGDTALTKASRTGDLEIVALLLNKGADVNAIETEARTVSTFHYGTPTVTPLVIGIESGNASLVRLLLAHGADPNLSVRRRVGSGFLEKSPRLIAEAGANVEIRELLRGK